MDRMWCCGAALGTLPIGVDVRNEGWGGGEDSWRCVSGDMIDAELESTEVRAELGAEE